MHPSGTRQTRSGSLGGRLPAHLAPQAGPHRTSEPRGLTRVCLAALTAAGAGCLATTPDASSSETSDRAGAAAAQPSDPAAPSPRLRPALTPAPLSPEEQALLAAVDQRQAAAVALLEKAVNINSGTGNHAGVRAVGELFADAFAKLGMKTRWIPMGAVDRAGHLFAESGRPGQPCTILIGHLDTVFEPDSPFQSFERLSETVARGPGVVDAKGGNVVILEALAALKSAGRLDQHRFVVALSGDEEESGQPLEAARHDLLEAAKSCKTALGFEPGATHPHTATVARRGFTHWVLDVEATAGHSSRIFDPDIGAGAAFEAARFLEALRQKLGGRPFLSFNVGLLAAGTTLRYHPETDRAEVAGKTNVVPKTAVLAGDLRTLTTEDRERAKRDIQQIAAGGSLPRTQASVEFRDTYPPMAPTAGNWALFDRLDQVSIDLGYPRIEEVDPRAKGAADISVIAHLVDAIDGLGPVGGGAHTHQETIELPSLPVVAKRAAVFLHRLATDAERKATWREGAAAR